MRSQPSGRRTAESSTAPQGRRERSPSTSFERGSMVKSFPTRLREARELERLSRGEVGERLGVTGAAVASWEGGREPREGVRERIEAWLDNVDRGKPAVPADDLRPMHQHEGPGQFPRWLRATREKQGLSRRALAEKADIS